MFWCHLHFRGRESSGGQIQTAVAETEGHHDCIDSETCRTRWANYGTSLLIRQSRFSHDNGDSDW